VGITSEKIKEYINKAGVEVPEPIWLKRELLALEANENLCKNVLKLYEEKVKVKDSKNSHVLYALGITDIVPRGQPKYIHLVSDWPDIDGDFSDRDAAIDYLVAKYGVDKVAKLGTEGNWQTQNASNEASKSLGVNKFEIQAVIDSLPKYSANDARNETALGKSFEVMDNGKKFIEKHPYFKVVTKMIGTPSNAGVHASGVLMLNEDIDNYVGVDSRTNSAMLNMHQAEQYGMIKLDVLGLKTLTILNSALEIAGLPRDHLTKIPLNDQKVFDVLNDGKFLGIFQFDGDALRRLTRTLHVDTFDDLAILSALSRPGAAVGAESWVNRKKGEEQVVYPHPVLEPYLKETFGTLVFQEQVMRIANEVCGMDWGVVSKLRKAIGKSMGEEGMKPFSEPFINGLVEKGVDPNVAKSFWGDIIAFGSYSFNKSHTVAYGLVSYWTCYMKAYYPVEFAAATLTLEGDHEKMLELLRELHKEGVTYVPIHPEYSTDRWRVVNGQLIGPLTLIEGVGPKVVQQILSARARNEELSDRAKKLLSSPKTKIDELYPIKAAIDRIDLKEFNILTEPKTVEQIIPDGTWQDDLVLVGVVRSCTIKSENEEKRIQDRISRGQQGFVTGQDKYVDIRVATDDGEIFCKIGKREYLELAKEVVGKVEDDKTLICVKGTCTPEIKMLLVKRLKILGKI
jgi:DNA polymerase III alpha subunit